MTLLKIAQLGEPILRQVARQLTPEELTQPRWQKFIDDMIETMRDADGAGLAATQVFEAVAIAVIEVRANNPRYPYKPPIPLTVLVNPVITPVGTDTFQNYEGCLSVADLRGGVERHARVRIAFLDRLGTPVHVEAAGLTAGTYQHECDHLVGRVFVDRVRDPATLTTWKNFDRYHKAAFTASATQIVAKYGG